MIYFSKSANGFFWDEINKKMPPDVVEVSDETYNALMEGQQVDGKTIISDDNGYPILTAPDKDYVLEAKNEQLVLLAYVDNVIADWRVELMLGEISEENKTKLSSWMAYKSAVKAVDISTAPDIIWPAPPY